MIRIIPLDNFPASRIDALLDAAFGADRHGRTAYAIRRGMEWLRELSFACLDDDDDDDGAMIGLLQSWPVALLNDAGSAEPLIMVGPVAVMPECQGRGIGRALMDHAMDRADAMESAPLMMIGDPEYYGRFWGFDATPTALWRVPGPVDPRRLLVRARPGQAVPCDGMLGPRVTVSANG